jgi:hypothetical protein
MVVNQRGLDKSDISVGNNELEAINASAFIYGICACMLYYRVTRIIVEISNKF